MLPSNQRSSYAVQQLQDITGCTRKAAIDLLRQHNFNLERAIDTFYTLSAERRLLLLANSTEARRPEESAIDEQRAAEFFSKYAVHHTSGDAITDEGLERFSSDLNVGLDDVFFLVFAFHCGCRTQGVITRDDFTRGLRALRVDTLEALKTNVPALRKAPFSDVQQLRKVYSYAFTYSLEPLQKQLPTELAVAYWRLLLEPLDWCMFDHFIHYIESVSNLSSITKDVWLMVLEFVIASRTPREEGQEPAAYEIDRVLQEYEDDGAWPLVIDNFVEWMRDERRKTAQG